MPGLGTILNVVAVMAGTCLGVLLGHRLPGRYRETVFHALGLLTIALGISMVLDTRNFLIVMGAVLLGGVTGELMNIERLLERLGDFFQRRLASSSTTFSTGFVTASLLFCIGPMAIVGSIEDGLHGNYQILAVKSILDGFAALAFASTLGWGVGLSALSLLAYQGGITALAGVADTILTEPMVAEITATGGLLIFAIGIRLLEIRKIRVGNFLPALIYAPLLVAAVEAVKAALA